MPTLTTQQSQELQVLLLLLKEQFYLKLKTIIPSDNLTIGCHIAHDMSYVTVEMEERRAGNGQGEEIGYMNRLPVCCQTILTKI